jgi:hypothetical protein
MIMNDLELHRERELADLRMRMANSVTQFTRGLVNRENKDVKPQPLNDAAFPVTRGRDRKRKSEGWIKRDRSADRGPEESTEGVMNFVELQSEDTNLVATKAVTGQLDDEEDGVETESTSSTGVDEVDLKAVYSYACRLMRETLDVEGVCFIDIDGIDWNQAISSLHHTTSDPPPRERREFGVASSILGYSHSERFGAAQRQNWTPVARWDEESEISNPQLLGNKGTSRYAFARSGSIGDETTSFHNPAYASIAGHLDDGSYVSARTGREFTDGGFRNTFLAQFLLENSYGKIFNEGLPGEIRRFLPGGVTSAILVPIYDFEQHPFAMTCAYTTNKHKWFTPVQSRYLEVPHSLRLNCADMVAIRLTNSFASIEETNHHGRQSKRSIHLQHLTRTPISAPRHPRFRRIHFRYRIR